MTVERYRNPHDRSFLQNQPKRVVENTFQYLSGIFSQTHRFELEGRPWRGWQTQHRLVRKTTCDGNEDVKYDPQVEGGKDVIDIAGIYAPIVTEKKVWQRPVD